MERKIIHNFTIEMKSPIKVASNNNANVPNALCCLPNSKFVGRL